MSKQINLTKSEAARHALAYGRFLEMLSESYSLVPNIHQVCRQVYDQYGNSVGNGPTHDIYTNSVNNMFQSYLTIRDRDLRTVVQGEMDDFKKEAKGASVESAARALVKQCFERVFNEGNLFIRIFNVDPQWNSADDSAFQAVKTSHLTLVHPGNIMPLATNLQVVLQTTSLQRICTVVGWLASEYLMSDMEEDESPFNRQCRSLAARLLADHLWPFTDASFEAEITKSITKGVVSADALKIKPVENAISSSNAYPLVKKAIELLALFDQAMPKERAVSPPPPLPPKKKKKKKD